MKKIIAGLQEDRLVYIFAVVGLLLVAFPTRLTKVAPILIGSFLVIYATASFVIYMRYKENAVNPGKAFVYLILGAAIMHQKGDAIGVIGSMWAMISLFEAAEEIDEEVKRKEYSVFRFVSIALSTFLAIMLLFDPFEHFELHMRILGVEMVLSIFERQHKIIRQKQENEI